MKQIDLVLPLQQVLFIFAKMSFSLLYKPRWDPNANMMVLDLDIKPITDFSETSVLDPIT